MLERIRVIVDYAQYRLLHDRNVTFVKNTSAGRNGETIKGWDRSISSNITIDPITDTLFIMPQVFRSAWNETTSGDYARKVKGDFTFDHSDKWEDNSIQLKLPGDHYLLGTTLEDEGFKTNFTLDKNQGVYLSLFGYNAGDEDIPFCNFGWGDTYNSGIHCKLYSGGKIVVCKDDKELAEYQFSGGKSTSLAQNIFVSFLLVPCRLKELLCVASSGSGFCHAFDHINAISESDPEITPSGPFWMYFPGSNRRAMVQLVPILYPTGGTAISYPQTFSRVPDESLGEATAEAIKDGNTVTCYATDANDTNVAFVADGLNRECRIKAVLTTSNNTRTPFVYGALAGYDAVIGYTNGDYQQDISDFVSELSIDATEQAGGTSGSVNIVRLQELEDTLGVTGIDTQFNRPIKFMLGDSILFEGRTQSPEIERRVLRNSDKITLEISGPWSALTNYQFTDMVPLNGLWFTSVIKWVVKECGIPEELIEVDEADIKIGDSQSPSGDTWTNIIEVGDTGEDVINRLFESYAGNWFYDFIPKDGVYKFVARDPDFLDNTSLWTYRKNAEEARLELVGMGVSSDDSRSLYRTRTYRTLKPRSIPPECNELRITGIDSRTGGLIQVFRINYDARDLSLAPNERPDTWWGEPKIAGLLIPELDSFDVLIKAFKKIWPRVSRRREICEFDSDLTVTFDGDIIWRGSVITLEDLGDYRIQSLSFSLVKDPDPEIEGGGSKWMSRPTSYVAEKIYYLNGKDTTTGHQSGGLSAWDIHNQWASGWFATRKWRKGYEKYQQETVQVIQEVTED